MKKRFLFVVPPLSGHLNPTVAVGEALRERGHAVAWCGCPSHLDRALPAWAERVPIDETRVLAMGEQWARRAQEVFGLESFKFFFEEFMLPLARAMYPGVRAACEAWKPDLVIVDQQAVAGSLAARSLGIPWVTSVTTSAGVVNPLEQFPKVFDWMIAKLGEIQDFADLPRVPRPDLSERAVVVFSVRELLARDVELGSQYHFVGASPRTDARAGAFPWERLRAEARRLYVTLGTLNAERSRKFYEKVVAAFGGVSGLQVIVSAPREMFPASDLPENFLVESWVPQVELLKRVDAVLFHGGHNTFCESLAAGRPVIVAPIKDDQPVIAQQAVVAGVGTRVHFDRVTAVALREAVERVLNDSAYRERAVEIQAALLASGGAQAAARLFEGVASAQGARVTACRERSLGN